MVSSREGKLAADYAGAQEAWLLENAARWAQKFVIGGGGHRGWQQQQIKPVQQQMSAGICKVSRHIILQKEKEIAKE